MIGHSFFLDIMLNGFGPKGTPHSLQATLRKTHQKKLETLSFWHDFFAPFDIIVVCCVLLALFPVFLGVGGAVVGGLEGFMTGGSLGVVSARISLPILNWWFGASEDLMASIHEELAQYQPLLPFLTDDHKQPNARKLQETVDSAAEKFEKHAVAATLDRQKASQRAEIIKQYGTPVLEELMKWILKDAHHDGRPIWKLLQARSHCFSTTERGLAILSFVDLDLFLMHYFDPHQEFVPHFLLDEREPQKGTWDSQSKGFQLTEVYMSWPHLEICTRVKGKASWCVVNQNCLQVEENFNQNSLCEPFLSNHGGFRKDENLPPL